MQFTAPLPCTRDNQVRCTRRWRRVSASARCCARSVYSLTSGTLPPHRGARWAPNSTDHVTRLAVHSQALPRSCTALAYVDGPRHWGTPQGKSSGWLFSIQRGCFQVKSTGSLSGDTSAATSSMCLGNCTASRHSPQHRLSGTPMTRCKQERHTQALVVQVPWPRTRADTAFTVERLPGAAMPMPGVSRHPPVMTGVKARKSTKVALVPVMKPAHTTTAVSPHLQGYILSAGTSHPRVRDYLVHRVMQKAPHSRIDPAWLGNAACSASLNSPWIWYKSTWSPLPAMARGSRFLRRHRPRDTLRQRARPPQHVRRRPMADERPEVVNSSSSSELAVIDDDAEDSSSSDPVARRNRTRPLTVFSVTTDRRPREEEEEESTGPDTLVPDSEVFQQTALRREMAPDEFMATAALLGRSYAVPENDRRSSTAPTCPPSSSSTAGYTLTGRLGTPSRGAQARSPGAAIIPCVDAYTASDVLHAVLKNPASCPTNLGMAYTGALHHLIRPEPYPSLLLQLVSQIARCLCCCTQPKQPAGRFRHMPTIMRRHPHSSAEDRTQHRATATKDAHTQPPRSLINMYARGHPGPKSGERSKAPATRSTWTYRVVMWLLRIQISTGTLDARVVTSAQGVTGAGTNPSTTVIRTPAKPSLGTQATHASHPRSSTRVHKRTYARALRRAQLKGGAWYRGTWIGPDPRHSPPPRDTDKHGRDNAPTRDNSRHYRALSWNTGALGGGLYDEFLLYLKRSNFDVVLLQETKWRFESMWEDATHYFRYQCQRPQPGRAAHHHLKTHS